MNDPGQKSLSADEIEAMLRARQDRQNSVRSDIVSNEPLGPGDVQHLQNTASSEGEICEENSKLRNVGADAWPGNAMPTDELLRQAEQQLEDAMSVRSELLDPPNSEFQSFSYPPIESRSSSTDASTTGIPLNVVGDIELDVSLELGRAELTIEELLQLREGSVVPLNTDASDPIDILANGRLVARGEVIVIDDKFGVRICEVISNR